MSKRKVILWESLTLSNTNTLIAYDMYNGEELGYITFKFDNGDEYPRYRNLCNGDKLIKIVRVETRTMCVGQGIASKLIEEVVGSYKDYNILLLCAPSPRQDYDTLKSVTDLKKFYEKFGFRKTGELIPTMIRKKNKK